MLSHGTTVTELAHWAVGTWNEVCLSPRPWGPAQSLCSVAILTESSLQLCARGRGVSWAHITFLFELGPPRPRQTQGTCPQVRSNQVYSLPAGVPSEPGKTVSPKWSQGAEQVKASEKSCSLDFALSRFSHSVPGSKAPRALGI